MNRRTFNPDQIRQLEANLHVASVSDRTIQYKGEFKIHAVRENLAGKRPIQIFEESGFDLDMIGCRRQVEFDVFCSFDFYTSDENRFFRFLMR